MSDVDREQALEIEKKVAVVDQWIRKVGTEQNEAGDVVVNAEELGKSLLREVLVHYGASIPERIPEEDVERKEALGKLRQKTNRHRRPGMNTVWGKEYMDNFNKFTTRWANAYEEQVRTLPHLEKSGNRTSGMRHFLGHLTAYAYEGGISQKIFEERMGDRLTNGLLYAQGKKKKDMSGRGYPEDKSWPGSIPPGFVQSCWEVIKSGVLKDGVPEEIEIGVKLEQTS